MPLRPTRRDRVTEVCVKETEVSAEGSRSQSGDEFSSIGGGASVTHRARLSPRNQGVKVFDGLWPGGEVAWSMYNGSAIATVGRAKTAS